MERLSLAQQIAQLEDVAPVDFDPEDIQVTGTDPDDLAVDGSGARAHYFDVGPSSLRKLNESLSDPKYDGTKTSRKMVLDESGTESDSVDEGSESGGSQGGSADEESGSHASGPSETRTFDHDTGAKYDVDRRITADVPTERPKQNGDLSLNLRKTREEDRKKGKAISRQIALWDSLVDARIRLQKSVTAGNRLPSSLQDAPDHQLHTSLMKMLEEARLLSDEIFDLQECLLSANESIHPPPRKRQRNTESGGSVTGYAEELREASHVASEIGHSYHPHLVQTLDKWSSKIQAVAPSILLPSNRNAFSRATPQIKSASQLIDETLADHGKVLVRTRIYRGKGSRLGVSTSDEDGSREKEDPGVFDDIDFYHQLLRDIIDARGDGASGNGDWMATQREKKAKKKVDTRASKGRRLRYEVHEKIQNFMVPMEAQGGWHEEQIDELFASLLGKGFEGAMQEAGEVAEESVQQEAVLLQGGFRLFG